MAAKINVKTVIKTLEGFAPMVGGAFVSAFAAKEIEKRVPAKYAKYKNWITNGALLAAGTAVTIYGKGVVRQVGVGMGVTGAAALASSGLAAVQHHEAAAKSGSTSTSGTSTNTSGSSLLVTGSGTTL